MLYTPHQPAPFDAECGTFEASAYEAGCSGASMLCGEGAEQGSLFVRCLRAINCKMKSEMRVDAEQDELALFMHQVILPAAPGVSNEGEGVLPSWSTCRLFLGPGFRLAARWNRLVETVKTRKKREKTGKKWARYGLRSVNHGS